jgi:hypothetical protein
MLSASNTHQVYDNGYAECLLIVKCSPVIISQQPQFSFAQSSMHIHSSNSITTLLTIRLGVRLWLHFKTPRLGLWKPPHIPHQHRLLVGYLANAVDAPKTSDRFSTLTLVPVAGMKLGAKCKCCLLKFPASRPLSRVLIYEASRARSPAALTSLSRPFPSSERYNLRSHAGIVTGVSNFRSCGKDRSEIARKAPDQERREQSSIRNDHLVGSQIEISSNAKPKPAQGPSNQSSSDEDTPMPDSTIGDVEYFSIPSTPQQSRTTTEMVQITILTPRVTMISTDTPGRNVVEFRVGTQWMDIGREVMLQKIQKTMVTR